MVAEAGDTATDNSVAGVTVTAAVLDLPSYVAVIAVMPALTPVTTPVAWPTVAMLVAPDDQLVVVLTSRVSIDLVQKCAALGASVLIAASAPTSAAVAMAEAAGLTLIGLARGDGFEIFTHPDRLSKTEAADVA